MHHNRLTRDDLGGLPASGVIVCRIRRMPLPSSTYLLGFSLMSESSEYLDHVDDAFELVVVDGNYYKSGEAPPISHGVCLVDAHWRLERTPAHVCEPAERRS
jgi:lipopolysaccharide transport system ATP-binding protein